MELEPQVLPNVEVRKTRGASRDAWASVAEVERGDSRERVFPMLQCWFSTSGFFLSPHRLFYCSGTISWFKIFFLLVAPCSMWDLSFLTRDQAHALCSGSMES